MNIIKSIKIYCKDQLIFNANSTDFAYVYFELDDYSLYIHPLAYMNSKLVMELPNEEIGVPIEFCTYYINDRKYDKLPIYEIACLYSNALTFYMKHKKGMFGIFGTTNPVVTVAEKTFFKEYSKYKTYNIAEYDKYQDAIVKGLDGICDFGVVLTRGYDEPKFKSFYDIVYAHYKKLGNLPESMFINDYESDISYIVTWDKSLLPYIAKMHFLGNNELGKRH